MFEYASMLVAKEADANNLENQRWVLVDCEQVFEDVGSGGSWNRTGLNFLKVAVQLGGLREGGGAGPVRSIADRGFGDAGMVA